MPPKKSGPGAVGALGTDRVIAGKRPDPFTAREADSTTGKLPKRIQLLDWRPMRRNTLRRFCNVELASGLKIHEIAIHTKAGKWWASLPARPVLDRAGKHVSDDSGHRQYAPLLSWRDRG